MKSRPLRIGLHASPAPASPDDRLDRAPPIDGHSSQYGGRADDVSLNCTRLRAEPMARCDAIFAASSAPVAVSMSVELPGMPWNILPTVWLS
jgi:hypothetical protein